jgi:phospholipid/cholesterol/gamma-HCH transport system ATP-binding protein
MPDENVSIESPQARVRRPPGEPKIVVTDLHKSFGGREVLQGLFLEIFPGESVVVMGASGTGKSVLLKHLIGLIRPDQGVITIDGEDLTFASARQWQKVRRKTGMAFQEGALFDSLDVFENVAFPLRRHTRMSERDIRARVEECLDLVQLHGVGSKLTNELSGGMRRRVGFARAVALEPEIMLFDEPNTGLDPVTSAVIDRVLNQLRRSMQVTMVTITHHVNSAFRIADRIAMLKEGRIIALAPPDEFRTLPDPYIEKFLAGEPPDEDEEAT